MLRSCRLAAALLSVCLPLLGCYTASAWRSAERIVRGGFDWEERGPWVVVSAPGSLLVAAGDLALGSVVPLHEGGVDRREPEDKWFHSYPGQMRPAQEVAILCHRDRSTWVSALRTLPDGAWQDARHRGWHFPVCIEALPGRYEIEVQYFARVGADDEDGSVTRQAESTAPSLVSWTAEAGQVYLLGAEIGKAGPAQVTPPQRHIPHSRNLGTTWWELEESEWTARIVRVSSWESLSGPVLEQRRAWMRYEERTR